MMSETQHTTEPHGWLDCKAVGLEHQPITDPNISIRVDDVVYEACSRCPVVIRRTR